MNITNGGVVRWAAITHIAVAVVTVVGVMIWLESRLDPLEQFMNAGDRFTEAQGAAIEARTTALEQRNKELREELREHLREHRNHDEQVGL